MLSLTLADPGTLSIIEPSAPECVEAWGTSFVIGRHVYGFRIESVVLADLGLEGFFDEQQIGLPANGRGLVVKFDNSLNEIDEQSAYRRLGRDDMLSVVEIRLLQQFLSGGIVRFMADHRAESVIGIPNDAKLAGWYGRLTRRVSLPSYTVEMRDTAFHPHKVLLVCRR